MSAPNKVIDLEGLQYYNGKIQSQLGQIGLALSKRLTMPENESSQQGDMLVVGRDGKLHWFKPASSYTYGGQKTSEEINALTPQQKYTIATSTVFNITTPGTINNDPDDVYPDFEVSAGDDIILISYEVDSTTYKVWQAFSAPAIGEVPDDKSYVRTYGQWNEAYDKTEVDSKLSEKMNLFAAGDGLKWQTQTLYALEQVTGASQPPSTLYTTVKTNSMVASTNYPIYYLDPQTGLWSEVTGHAEVYQSVMSIVCTWGTFKSTNDSISRDSLQVYPDPWLKTTTITNTTQQVLEGKTIQEALEYIISQLQ